MKKKTMKTKKVIFVINHEVTSRVVVEVPVGIKAASLENAFYAGGMFGESINFAAEDNQQEEERYVDEVRDLRDDEKARTYIACDDDMREALEEAELL